MIYLLRSFPCHGHTTLNDIDLIMKNCLEKITNCRLDPLTLTQASLPVKLGGLGIRRTTDICLPAFIASSNKCASIVEKLISPSNGAHFSFLLSEATIAWKSIDSGLVEPVGEARQRQKSWDLPVALEVLKRLINDATIPTYARARLLAVSSPHAGDWLNAAPIPSLGLNSNIDIPKSSTLQYINSIYLTCILNKD